MAPGHVEESGVATNDDSACGRSDGARNRLRLQIDLELQVLPFVGSRISDTFGQISSLQRHPVR